MREITVDELAKDESIPVIDVREPSEWNVGHVPRATHIPLAELASRLDEVPDDAAIICKSGGRSARAVEALERFGRQTANVVGGTDAWIAAGHPTDSGSDATH